MKTSGKYEIIWWAISFLGVFGLAKGSWAETINAASCSFADVSAAINAATAGDVIIIPAGACTWSSNLTITKGVILLGAGADKTIITSNAPGALIVYAPADLFLNAPFRFSGFTLDFNNEPGEGPGFYLNPRIGGIPQTRIRIDHNNFKNAMYALGAPGMFGVVDSNTFENFNTPSRHSWCSFDYGLYNWEHFPEVIFGADENNLYYEDNVFTNISSQMTDAQCGQRYAYRYNTYYGTADSFPVFDMHGNYYGGPETIWYSTMGGEVYGNNFFFGNYQGYLADQRGGKGLWFNNNINTTGSFTAGKVRDEQADSLSPLVIHPERIQHVNDTYFWNNMKNYNSRLNNVSQSEDCCSGDSCVPACVQNAACCYNGPGQPSLKENAQFWNYNSNFNGTSGIGCGALAARPATCTAGVGYWATNQSCSDLTGMVGAHPTTAISGTFYKCTASNTWSSYYTPLTYPHPLRIDCANYPTLCDSDTNPPAAPTGLAVQ